MRIPILCASFVLGGCGIVGQFDPNYALATYQGPSGTVRLIKDSAKVRELIAAQERRFDEEKRIEAEAIHSRRILSIDDLRNLFPGRFQFLDAMSREPGVDVPNGSYARQLEAQSKAPCLSGGGSATYTKVRITTGTKAGEEGWACFGFNVSPTFP